MDKKLVLKGLDIEVDNIDLIGESLDIRSCVRNMLLGYTL